MPGSSSPWTNCAAWMLRRLNNTTLINIKAASGQLFLCLPLSGCDAVTGSDDPQPMAGRLEQNNETQTRC